MEIFKVMVSFDNNGDMFLADGIHFQDSVWIVSKWLDYPALGNKQPERIIQIPSELLQHTPDSSMYRYLLTFGLPNILRTALNQSEIPKGYAVQFLPDLMFPIQS